MEGNPAQELSLAEHRDRLAAARSSLSALSHVLWQVPSGGGPDGLAGLLGEVDALGAACDAGRVAVTREAMDRGETSDGPAAMSTVQWVRHHAPSTRAGGAGTVVSVAQAFGRRVNAPVQAAVEAGRLPVVSAAAVVSEFEKLSPVLGELMQEPALSTLIETAADHGPQACRKVRPFILARYGATTPCNASRTSAPPSSGSPRRRTPGPAPSSTGSPSTWRASRSSRPPSARCPHPSRPTGNGTCVLVTVAAVTPWWPW